MGPFIMNCDHLSLALDRFMWGIIKIDKLCDPSNTFILPLCTSPILYATFFFCLLS